MCCLAVGLTLCTMMLCNCHFVSAQLGVCTERLPWSVSGCIFCSLETLGHRVISMPVQALLITRYFLPFGLQHIVLTGCLGSVFFLRLQKDSYRYMIRCDETESLKCCVRANFNASDNDRPGLISSSDSHHNTFFKHALLHA